MREVKLHLEAIPLTKYGYAHGGRGQYYGTGAKLYRLDSEDGEIHKEFRAVDRKDAKKVSAGYMSSFFKNHQDELLRTGNPEHDYSDVTYVLSR
jgi:hypothetical protein